jgi:hypothetical protein
MNNNGYSGYESPRDIILHPVGVIHNTVKEPFLVAGEDGLSMRGDHRGAIDRARRTREEISEIVIREELVDILEVSRNIPTLLSCTGHMPFPVNAVP